LIGNSRVPLTLALACGLMVGPTIAGAAAVQLQPYSVTYAVTATAKGKTLVTARWRDTLDVITVAGKQAYRRTQVSLQSNGVSRTWVSVFDTEAFSAIADTFSTSDGDIFARVFTGSRVTDYTSNGSSRGILTSSTTELPPNYSDFNGGQFGLALLELPLAPHYQTTLTTFGSTDATVQSVPIEVLRTETLRLGACSLDAIVVRATFSAKYYPDEGDNYMTFWLTKRRPYVAQLITDAPRSGVTVTYKLDDQRHAC
jgi:hypothetical protein